MILTHGYVRMLLTGSACGSPSSYGPASTLSPSSGSPGHSTLDRRGQNNQGIWRYFGKNSESKTGFRIRIFFADPDPGKNFHADPDPGGIRGRGLGVKGKMIFFFEFFSRFR